MKKYGFDIASAALLIVDAILWLLGYLIEGFNYNWLIFLDVLLLGWAVINIVMGFTFTKVWRVIVGGIFFMAGLFTMFISFDLLHGFVPYLVIVIISIAMTSIMSIILRKGKKWDAGDNDKE